MKYFVTINTLSSTTKLGRLLTDSVLRRYQNALVLRRYCIFYFPMFPFGFG